MSRFIELLEKTGERAPSRLGFAPAVSREAAPPQIPLVARVLAENLAKDPELAEADATALLVGAAAAVQVENAAIHSSTPQPNNAPRPLLGEPPGTWSSLPPALWGRAGFSPRVG